MTISEDVLSQSIREISALSPTMLGSHVRTAAMAQPELFAFVVQLTEECSEETRALALMTLVTIMRAYERGVSHPIRQVDGRALMRAQKKNEWMVEAIVDGSLERLDAEASRNFRQPILLRFLVETLVDDDLPIAKEEAALVFFVFTAVIDALDAASRPRRKPRLTLVTPHE